ncbi:MAG: hypothetical protein R3304_05515 [Longimicrobiales bacterium]|nr:hypothetical protein [Longimicrobiales bacterium]
MIDERIRTLVEENPGQASFEEYKLVHEVVSARAPCNLLVFGVGRDSALWMDTNAGGRTIFLEDVAKWAAYARERVPGITVHDVRYRTLRILWPLLRRFPGLLMMKDLPAGVKATEWDVILVDAPRGSIWHRPGRMKSIYTASVLARRNGTTDVLLHDCNRQVEDEAGRMFLGQDRMVTQVGTMRHYRVG